MANTKWSIHLLMCNHTLHNKQKPCGTMTAIHTHSNGGKAHGEHRWGFFCHHIFVGIWSSECDHSYSQLLCQFCQNGPWEADTDNHNAR